MLGICIVRNGSTSPNARNNPESTSFLTEDDLTLISSLIKITLIKKTAKLPKAAQKNHAASVPLRGLLHESRYLRGIVQSFCILCMLCSVRTLNMYVVLRTHAKYVCCATYAR